MHCNTRKCLIRHSSIHSSLFSDNKVCLPNLLTSKLTIHFRSNRNALSFSQLLSTKWAPIKFLVGTSDSKKWIIYIAPMLSSVCSRIIEKYLKLRPLQQRSKIDESAKTTWHSCRPCIRPLDGIVTPIVLNLPNCNNNKSIKCFYAFDLINVSVARRLPDKIATEYGAHKITQLLNNVSGCFV